MEQSGTAVAQALKVAQHLKEMAVRREGVGADIAMTLHLRRDGVALGVATLPGDRDEVLDKIVRVAALSDADQVIHVVDAYGAETEASEDLDVARAFAAGDPAGL